MAVTGIKSKPLEQVRADVPTEAAAGDDQVRFNFYIRRSKLRALRREAFDREVSVADIIREALDARVGKRVSE